MSREFILKKLEQMKSLLSQLQELLVIPFSEFKGKFTNVRSSERNFQLIIELASDINTHVISELGAEIPDTYRESFKRMVSLKILPEHSLSGFIKSSNLRKILIHEYDFDEDNFIFYTSAKEFLPLYKEYIRFIQKYIESQSR